MSTPRLLTRALTIVLAVAPSLAALADAATAAQDPSSKGGWHSLFDGASMDAWRGWSDQAVPAGGRILGNGLMKDGPVDDLISREQFGNFELELEWKIGKGGNSG